jgi:predicted phosphodiesterase
VQARTLIIGDVHGCIAELETLLRTARVSRDTRIVLVGDLVAKGPYSRHVVDFCRDRGVLAVRGNHDEAVVRYWKAARKGKELPRLGRSGQEALEQLDDKHLAWLAALPYVLRLEPDLVVVHGGLAPGVRLDRQDPEVMLTLRSVLPGGKLSDRAGEGVPWASRWKGPERVVFGHDALRGLQRYPWATGLDTGCCYGRELTALELTGSALTSSAGVRTLDRGASSRGERLLSVPARRAYAEVRRAASA